MWSILLLYLSTLSVNVESNTRCQGDVENTELVENFREAYDEFAVKIFKTTTPRSPDVILMSPILAYMTLIAMAEGADETSQDEIFDLLNLPRDTCKRQQYYSIVLTIISNSEYLKMDSFNALFVDQDVQLNMNWYNTAKNFMQVSYAPIKKDPEYTEELLNQIVSFQDIDLDLSGNSVLISTLSYGGLWTTSFDDAIIENKPFYNQAGEQVGSVDFMTTEGEFRMSEFASIFAPLIEIPCSIDGEYRMFIGIVDDEADLIDTIRSMDETAVQKMVASLQDNYKYVKVSIPRFNIISTVDMKDVLQDMGLRNFWEDPSATRNISTPPAQPSSYIQKLTVDINTKGIHPPPPKNTSDQETEEFIANRPFAFALYHGKSFANIFVGSYIKPPQADS